jgi:hypothetical protein
VSLQDEIQALSKQVDVRFADIGPTEPGLLLRAELDAVWDALDRIARAIDDK